MSYSLHSRYSTIFFIKLSVSLRMGNMWFELMISITCDKLLSWVFFTRVLHANINEQNVNKNPHNDHFTLLVTMYHTSNVNFLAIRLWFSIMSHVYKFKKMGSNVTEVHNIRILHTFFAVFFATKLCARALVVQKTVNLQTVRNATGWCYPSTLTPTTSGARFIALLFLGEKS